MSSPERSPPPNLSLFDWGAGIPVEVIGKLAAEYRPWRTFRYVASELGADPRAAWRCIKAMRGVHRVDLSFPRAEGGGFHLCWCPTMLRSFFVVDRASGDDLLSTPGPGPLRSTLRKRMEAMFKGGELVPTRLQVKTAMQEAAESSIIEGASATRERALELLRMGQVPRSPGERMILNNYRAMQLVRSRVGEPMSVELLLELQETLVAGTLEKPDAAGRFRDCSEDVRVVDTRDETTVFVPPSADQIPLMLRRFCEIANGGVEGRFIHPIALAAILHFLLGYIHPFVDGNGRTARAVFYWSAMRSGYSIVEYLSISEIIGRGFARYPQAFLDAEQDEGDLTYFVLYTLNVLEQAIGSLSDHLRHEETRIERAQIILRLARDLNLRQRLLLEHAARHPHGRYTVKGHANSNGTTLVTARTDLDRLVKLKLLTARKDGREVIYIPAPSLARRLAEIRRKDV